jgi:hypothetical protein
MSFVFLNVILFTPTALGFVCNSILCRWQQEVWFCCIRFALCGTREYIKWLLPISLRWNGVRILYFAHPYLTLNYPYRLYLFLSLFLLTIAYVFPIRAAVKRRLQIESYWGVYHAYAKYVLGLWTYFELFLWTAVGKKPLLLYLRAPLFPYPLFRFVESHGWDQ